MKTTLHLISIKCNPNTIKMSSGEDFTKLLEVKRNQVQMMSDRGYDVSAESPIFDYTPQQFVEVYSGFLSDTKLNSVREALTTEYGNARNRVCVHYLPWSQGDISKKQINKFVEKMDRGACRSYILVTNNPLGSSTKKAIQNHSRQVVHFTDKNLSVNPTLHVSVPLHEGLSMEESDIIISRNNWDRKRLPQLKPYDPTVRWMGFTRGQMVRIHRSNPLEGSLVDTFIAYAIVADSSDGMANELIISSYDGDELE